MYIESQNCANIWNVPKKANTVLIKIQISNCAYTLIPHTTCICKSSEHLALDCPHSWYRRPQKIDPENDLVVENILAEVTQKAILVMLRKTVLVMTPLLLGIPRMRCCRTPHLVLVLPLTPISLLLCFLLPRWAFLTPRVWCFLRPLSLMKFYKTYSCLMMKARMRA